MKNAAAAPTPVRSTGFSLIALWTLYTLTIRQHLHGRRWIVMAVLCLLTLGLAVLIRATAPEMPAIGHEFILVFLLIPQALLPLVALVYAPGIIQDEQEEQTLTYLLIRPIPRWAIYVVKMLATLTVTLALSAIFTTVTFAATNVGSDTAGSGLPLRCLKTVAIHGMAIVAYCSLFGLISLYTKRSLIVCIGYTVAIEGVLANLPFSLRLITVIYYSRIIAYRSMDFVITERGHQADMAKATWQIDNIADHPTLQNCLLILIVGSLACTVLGALICARREFHVKTPEGS